MSAAENQPEARILKFLPHPSSESFLETNHHNNPPSTQENDETQSMHFDESNSIRVAASHLREVSANKVILLNDISLTIPPRTFVALVGSSGTGKSTLMGALNGLRPAHEGKVLYNGQNYYPHISAFSKQLGYVPQDDIVHRELTVERALYYSAKMRLPADFTTAQIEERINEVLEEVDMKTRRHVLINQLSGGQRKRVSIALELLDKPSIFFLDEPTSGLDPGLDHKMMLLLRRLADKGHTIVLITHATNNINICDYICFLAQGGRLVYFGPPDKARAYFGKSDFAEIYSLLEPDDEHPHAPEQAEERFKASLDYQKYVARPLKEGYTLCGQPAQNVNKDGLPKRSNPWNQFLLLSLRYLELLKNDPGNLLILLLQAPVIALLLVLLIKYGIGNDVFAMDNIVQCPTTASIITSTGLPDIPGPIDPEVSTACGRVEKFLKNDPRGKAYASRRGGTRTALQDFILEWSGSSPQKILFIMSFTAVLFGCVNAAREIVKEAPIYQRERAVGLCIIPYMFSKIVVLALLCFVQSAILVMIVYVVDPLYQGVFLPALLEVYLTMALTALAGLMTGLTVSVVAPTTDRAMSLVPIILIPQVIFSGIVFPLNNWAIQILSMAFATRWSIAALGTTVGLHSDKMGGDNLLRGYAPYHGIIFSIYSQADAVRHLLMMWAVLGAMIILLACVVGIFLKRKDAKV